MASNREWTGPPGGGGPRGAALAWAGWWLLLFGFWVALANKTAVQELATGAVAATLGSSAAVLVRQERRVVSRPRAVWLGGLARRVATIPRDLVRLGQALLRPTEGELVEVTFVVPPPDQPRPAAARVLAGVAGSLAPNTVVVTIDDDRRVLVAHRLVARGEARADADPLELG